MRQPILLKFVRLPQGHKFKGNLANKSKNNIDKNPHMKLLYNVTSKII